MRKRPVPVPKDRPVFSAMMGMSFVHYLILCKK
jgi:hypothetical protein